MTVADAKAKIATEMAASPTNAFIQFIGKFLLLHLEANPGDADKLSSGDKSIAKSLDAMKAAAQKKERTGNMAMLTPDEGCAIVLKYYGIEGAASAAPVSVSVEKHAPVAPAPTAATAPSRFNVSLDDYL